MEKDFFYWAVVIKERYLTEDDWAEYAEADDATQALIGADGKIICLLDHLDCLDIEDHISSFVDGVLYALDDCSAAVIKKVILEVEDPYNRELVEKAIKEVEEI